jgi:hypothetical protein
MPIDCRNAELISAFPPYSPLSKHRKGTYFFCWTILRPLASDSLSQGHYTCSMGKRILLYGKSVLVAGLASSLGQIPDLEIITGENLEFTEQTTPDLILVDLCDSETVHTLPMLCSHSEMPLVGINPTTSTMTVISGVSHSAQSMQELMEFLSEVMQQNSKPLPTGNKP